MGVEQGEAYLVLSLSRNKVVVVFGFLLLVFKIAEAKKGMAYIA